MATKEAAVLVGLPGLNAIAQQKFDLPYEELSPSLQSFVREEAVRRAAPDMLAALKLADYRLTYLLSQQQRQPKEYEITADHIGTIRAAIALAEGR